MHQILVSTSDTCCQWSSALLILKVRTRRMPSALTRQLTSFGVTRLACQRRLTNGGQRSSAVVPPFRGQPPKVVSEMGGRVDYSQGKLYARPAPRHSVDQSPPALGLQPLGTGARQDGLLYTPSSYKHGQPSPLCIMMHGAGGNAKGALFPPLEDIAEKVSKRAR